MKKETDGMATSSALVADAAFLHLFRTKPSDLTWWLSMQMREIAKRDPRAVLPAIRDVYVANVRALSKRENEIWSDEPVEAVKTINEGYSDLLYREGPKVAGVKSTELCIDIETMATWDTLISERLRDSTSNGDAAEQLEEGLFTRALYRNFIRSRLPKTALLAAQLTGTTAFYVEALMEWANAHERTVESEVKFALDQLAQSIQGPQGKTSLLYHGFNAHTAGDFDGSVRDAFFSRIIWKSSKLNDLFLGSPRDLILSILKGILEKPETTETKNGRDALIRALDGPRWWEGLRAAHFNTEFLNDIAPLAVSWGLPKLTSADETPLSTGLMVRTEASTRIVMGILFRAAELDIALPDAWDERLAKEVQWMTAQGANSIAHDALALTFEQFLDASLNKSILDDNALATRVMNLQSVVEKVVLASPGDYASLQVGLVTALAEIISGKLEALKSAYLTKAKAEP